ncbi:hypothetical protein AMJ80_10850 [bacterium SM23_31]|nr:MAG: hypothetical protein AMJ80_10850 [bacterium SM23_31]
MYPKINININILPFGSIVCEIKGFEFPIAKEESKIPIYTEPTTTNIEKVEINYKENHFFLVPKTTSGL